LKLYQQSSKDEGIHMDKLIPTIDGTSADIVEQNVELMKQLFPDVFTEGKIDCDCLNELLGEYIDDRQERYSFTWNGKSLARKIAQTPSTGTLRPCPNESVNWESTQNLFIEGDNLETLKLLQKSYHKKIKLIYIDPPYNTGRDFIYPDNFHDSINNYMEITGQTDESGRKISSNPESSGRYHTDWLNMIYPRLKLARNLLCNDGVVFISIDDHEVFNLRQVCNEIFGEEFVEVMVWEKVGEGDAGAGRMKAVDRFRTDHEYIIAAYKEIKPVFNRRMEVPQFKHTYGNPDNDPRGPYKAGNMSKTEDKSLEGGKNFYSVVSPSGKKFTRQWHFAKDEFERLDNDNRIYWGKVGDAVPAIKIFTSEPRALVNSSLLSNVGSATSASKNQRKIFDGKDLIDNPKPVKLIDRLISISTDKSDLIMDFFAGSCTTAHAVLNVNHKDKGKRKFIMVQLPEPCDESSEAYKAGYKTIADIGKERIRRAMKSAESDEQEGQLIQDNTDVSELDLGFKVFKLDSSNIKAWDADIENLEDSLFDSVENIKPERTESDVLYELLIKYGLDLAVPIEEKTIDGKAVYIIGHGALIVCLDRDITLDVVEGIAALRDELKPEVVRVVFKDSGFKDDVVKTNAVQILRQAGIEDVKSL